MYQFSAKNNGYTMKRIALLSLTLIFTLSLCFAQNKEGAGELTEHKLKHKGIEYSYYLYTPKGLPANAPLVIAFHGYGANQFPATRFGFNPVADKNGFAVCYPTGPKDFKEQHCWAVGYSFHKEKNWERDDIGFTIKLVKHLQKKYGFSKENIFATGHSNGGEMSYLLAYKAPHIFAAVAPISGLTMEWMYRELEAKEPIPLMEIHGTEDVVSKWNGDPYNKDGWGSYLAVLVAVSNWASINRCTHIEYGELPVKEKKVKIHRFVNGINGNQVWLYEVEGGTHALPDKSMNIAEEIWKFFTLYIK